MNPQPMNPQMSQPMSRGSKTPWIVLAVVVVLALAILGYMFRDKLKGSSSSEKLSGYQAVFLTNGQVYFGKLSNANSDYLTLKDIYYLQVNQQNLQSGQTAADQQPQLSLVKLGNELHGPVDSMQINHSQVLFFEDLKSDGRVAQAIAQYKANPQTPAAQTQTQTQTPAATTPTTPKK